MPRVGADLKLDSPILLRTANNQHRLGTAAQPWLAADNRQLAIPEFVSILASGLLWHGVDGQRCLLQLKPDPLGSSGAPSIPQVRYGVPARCARIELRFSGLEHRGAQR